MGFNSAFKGLVTCIPHFSSSSSYKNINAPEPGDDKKYISSIGNYTTAPFIYYGEKKGKV